MNCRLGKEKNAEIIGQSVLYGEGGDMYKIDPALLQEIQIL